MAARLPPRRSPRHPDKAAAPGPRRISPVSGPGPGAITSGGAHGGSRPGSLRPPQTAGYLNPLPCRGGVHAGRCHAMAAARLLPGGHAIFNWRPAGGPAATSGRWAHRPMLPSTGPDLDREPPLRQAERAADPRPSHQPAGLPGLQTTTAPRRPYGRWASITYDGCSTQRPAAPAAGAVCGGAISHSAAVGSRYRPRTLLVRGMAHKHAPRQSADGGELSARNRPPQSLTACSTVR